MAMSEHGHIYCIINIDGHYWTGNGWSDSIDDAKKFHSAGEAAEEKKTLTRLPGRFILHRYI